MNNDRTVEAMKVWKDPHPVGGPGGMLDLYETNEGTALFGDKRKTVMSTKPTDALLQPSDFHPNDTENIETLRTPFP